jgi:molecular chaperone GrpE
MHSEINSSDSGPLSGAAQNSNSEENVTAFNENALIEWKNALLGNVQDWFNNFNTMPEETQHQDESDGPDIYSFYEELCAMRNEVRTSGRKNQEIFSTFNDVLSGFEERMQLLQEKFTPSDNRESPRNTSLQNIFLPLVSIVERIERLGTILQSKPQPGLFNAASVYGKYLDTFTGGFSLVEKRLHALIREYGIERIDTSPGVAFNPLYMSCIETGHSIQYEKNTVLEELSAGYLFKGDVLKLAEVKISIGNGKDD